MASSVSTSTLPPTELRIIYPPNSVGPQQDHVFPNRIRFSQSQIPESEPSTIMSVGSPNHLGSAPRAGSESFQEANQFIADTSADQRAAAANLIMPPFHVTRILAFSQSLINQSTASYRGENLAADNSSRNNITAASDEPGTSRQRLTSGTGVDERAAVRMLDNGLAATSSSSAGAGTGGGPITVGGLIGIIAGVLTALVLAGKWKTLTFSFLFYSYLLWRDVTGVFVRGIWREKAAQCFLQLACSLALLDIMRSSAALHAPVISGLLFWCCVVAYVLWKFAV